MRGHTHLDRSCNQLLELSETPNDCPWAEQAQFPAKSLRRTGRKLHLVPPKRQSDSDIDDSKLSLN